MTRTDLEKARLRLREELSSGDDEEGGAKAAATDVEERMARAARRGAVLCVFVCWRNFKGGGG